MQRFQDVVLLGGPGCIRPAPFAMVEVYLAGSTTLANVFEQDGSAPLAQPFKTDEMGNYFFYVEDGYYDIRVYSPGRPEKWLRDIKIEDINYRTPTRVVWVAGTDFEPGETSFVLPSEPASKEDVTLHFDGAFQQYTEYDIIENRLILKAGVPEGTQQIEVSYVDTTPVPVPDVIDDDEPSNDKTFSSAKLASDGGAESLGYQFDPSSPFSVSIKQKHLNDGVLNAAYFGVRMENTADDQTEAFAKMTGWLRNEADTTGRLIELGPYDFNVEGGLDLTNIRCDHGKGFWMIDGRGARIIGRTAGMNAVLDATRSLGGRLDNITVIGDASAMPRNGLQLARAITGESADFITLNNVKCDGSFSQAAFYNFSAERFQATACLFRNANDAAGTYAYILDGRNKFDAESDFYAVDVPVDTPQSCLSQLFLQCSFMRLGGGSANPLDAIYFTRGSRIRMLNCYGVGTSGGAVVVFGADGSDIQDIDLDLHVESSSLGNAFRFESADGVATALTVDNFSWKDNLPYSSDAYFRNDLSGDVTLRGAKIDIGGQHDPAPTNGVFYPKAQFRMRGELRLLTNNAPSNIDIARFDGDIHYRNASALTLPTTGSFRVVQNAAGQFHGPFEFKNAGVWPTGTWTAGVTFATPGDLSVTYTSQSGTWTKVGDLVFVQVEIAFNPTHTTASGALRLTGLPYPVKSGPRTHSSLVLNSISAGITWPSGCTALSVRAPASQTYLEIRGVGSATAPASIEASNVASGSNHVIMLSGVYKANA